LRALLLTCVSMLAFAANSLLCRLALVDARIDPASFGLLRLASGALVLTLIVRWRAGAGAGAGVSRPEASSTGWRRACCSPTWRCSPLPT